MDKLTIGMLIILLGIGFFGIAIQGQLATHSNKREALLNEYEYVMADVWAENECLKDQLGIFNAPNGCN